ncbi:MAG: hypothetical protein AB4368_09960 [Xenococcaceae cyanobacterium]
MTVRHLNRDGKQSEGGKQAKTVITTASSHELSVGQRTIAVRLVDVFGNDASATVEVK